MTIAGLSVVALALCAYGFVVFHKYRAVIRVRYYAPTAISDADFEKAHASGLENRSAIAYAVRRLDESEKRLILFTDTEKSAENDSISLEGRLEHALLHDLRETHEKGTDVVTIAYTNRDRDFSLKVIRFVGEGRLQFDDDTRHRIDAHSMYERMEIIVLQMREDLGAMRENEAMLVKRAGGKPSPSDTESLNASIKEREIRESNLLVVEARLKPLLRVKYEEENSRAMILGEPVIE